MMRGLAAIAGLLVALSAAPAGGQTCTAAATANAFGTYNPFSVSPVNSTATVTVTCQALIPVIVSYTIQLSTGTGGSFAARSMAGPSSHLLYQLYRDAARTQIWGDGTSSTFTVADGYLVTVVPVMRNYTAFSQLLALQQVAPGSYTDTVTVLVTY
jgi:spore coat protein U-like protein